MITAQQEDQRDGQVKTGVIPDKEIRGSDSDRAYDSEGNFAKPSDGEKEPDGNDGQAGSDADTDR